MVGILGCSEAPLCVSLACWDGWTPPVILIRPSKGGGGRIRKSKQMITSWEYREEVTGGEAEGSHRKRLRRRRPNASSEASGPVEA